MSGRRNTLFDQPEPKSPLARYCLLSETCALRVSPLCIGGMNFGTNWSSWMGPCDKATTFAMLDEYYALGGNFIDTAVNYQDGQSEEWIGDWIEERKIPREELVIATKFSIPPRRGVVNMGGNSKKNMVSCLELSLKRLKCSYVDLYYVHYWDYATNPTEILRALDDAVRAGKILFPAISDTPAWVVSRMNTLAECKGLSPFVMYQGKYNLKEREMERDIMPMCREMGVAVIPWGVLGQGKFTGKYSRASPEATSQSFRPLAMDSKDHDIVDILQRVASKHSSSVAHVALAWCLAKKGVPSVLVGCRTLEQLRDNMKALEVKLTEEDMKDLDKISEFDMGFPHSFLGGTKREDVKWIRPVGVIEDNF